MIPNLGVGFALRCFQRLSRPNNSYSTIPLVGKPIDQRFVQPGPLVLGSNSLKYQTPTAGRDQPVSRIFYLLLLRVWTIPPPLLYRGIDVLAKPNDLTHSK